MPTPSAKTFSPTPWRLSESKNDEGQYFVEYFDKEYNEWLAVWDEDGVMAQDDGEYLIEAVNQHAALLEAAILARKAILENGKLTDALIRAHNALDKVITKAERG